MKRIVITAGLAVTLALAGTAWAGGHHHHHHRHHHHHHRHVSIGVVVPFLPSFHETVWYGGVPYYHAHGVYYRWLPARRGYVVTRPPAEERKPAPSGDTRSELFIYPKNGQSEEQQGRDRFECHRWAAGQSGFDPTQPMGGVSESEMPTKRADYLRAQQACLEARGYSVR